MALSFRLVSRVGLSRQQGYEHPVHPDNGQPYAPEQPYGTEHRLIESQPAVQPNATQPTPHNTKGNVPADAQ